MQRVNEVNLEGRCVRIDARKGLSKTGSEFISMTFTLSIEDNQIKVETFSMKNKKDGSLLKSYEGLMTLFLETKCQHKTLKDADMEKSEEVEDDTIVENIEDCTAISFSNYGKFKYCRFVENSYISADGLKKSTRIEACYPNRVDEDKKEYKPKREFEICGEVIKAPTLFTSVEDDSEYLKMTVEVPIYQESYKDKESSVSLHEIEVECHDEQYFDYIQDNFELGTKVYLNGEIVRRVHRVEVVEEDNEVERGFGKVIKHEPQFRNNVEERFEILGGYELDEDDLMDMEEKEFNPTLWEKARAEKEKKLAEMQNENRNEKQVGFGRDKGDKKDKDVKGKDNNLPFF